ncbi:MAG: protein kinase [Richelia sp. CSU_2_1]|nr:protein kinase [Richelia sp. CSU_2_1]
MNNYCINPQCHHQENPDNLNFCRSCGSKLTIDDRYRVIRPLGKGGFGQTYEVKDRDGTLKVLKVLTYTAPKGVQLFQQEANVLQRLRHSGLPKVEEDGYFTFKPNDTSNSLHCLVMEKIEGKNLKEWLEERNYEPISSEQAVEWLTQLTKILHRVHHQNYFHRDIKPQNIMCRSSDGQLVLIDFGAVREVTETIQKTSGEVTKISSAGYTPPEQRNGKAEPRSDFFALGRTFVYLLTAQDPINLSEDSRSGKLIWRTFATGVSKPVADLIDDLMAHFPNGRPKDTEALLQRLEKLIDRTQSTTIITQPTAFPLKPALTGAGIAIAIALGALTFQHFSKTPVENFLTYQSSEHQFAMKYPERWEKQELQNPLIADVLVFTAPKKNSADAYQEQMIVRIEDLPRPMSLEEYNKWSIGQIKTTFTDVNIIEETAKTVANNSGYAVVFDAKEGEKSLKKMQAWTLINNKAYVLTYTAEKSDYPEYLKSAEGMVESFAVN